MVIITTDYSRVPKVVATGSEPGNTFLVLVNQAIEPGEVCGAGTPDQLDAAYFLQCLEYEWPNLAFKPVFEIQTFFLRFPQSFRCHVLITPLFLCLLGPQKARPPQIAPPFLMIPRWGFPQIAPLFAPCSTPYAGNRSARGRGTSTSRRR